MIFTSFKAMHGDSLLISTQKTKVLIDGGTPNTYGQIINTLDDNSLSAVFVTHVDYDHIGGIINLIEDDNYNIDNCIFYMNHPDLICEYQGNKVGFKHGDTVNDLLKRRKKTFNSIKSQDIINIDDIQLLALSPTENDILELHKNWNANKFYIDDQLTYIKRQKNNGDIINKSSIVLIITHNNINILLLGDAHAKPTCEELIKLGYSIKKPIFLDLIKISHHGSKHNTSKELLELVDCTNFYISTNGGNYNHPDKETIKLLADRATELNTTFNIYLNYDIEEDIRDKCIFSLKSLNFIYENVLDLKCQ
ncbi:MBL fold metallo-hydrolase [Photobacterium carnosum]|uniref:ComEC/Rec2 family competence protein n=1 Tax=Photobacterium carnosum TaxID=2023717 RepID=UPI001F1A71B3|nr:MBL fold metallo-hydrolase [Photobacterium carnosum]MCF2304895.1 MBL fold metallo-hydrolase [Photobacterium carnosum]